jgi:phospholipid transport system substrate-binding protein
MKKLGFLIFFLTLFFNTSFASNYSNDPKDFIEELVNDTLTVLSNKNLTSDEKANYIEKIALNNIDIKALGLYTLGEVRKSADKEIVSKYQIAFEKYFLKSLTSRLTDYSSNKLEVINAEKKNAIYTMVKSKIKGNNNQPEIKIDWRVYTKDINKPLIRDLIVEGLSLARTQKEEFSSILNSNNNDIKILILKLEDFLNNK